MLKSGYFSNNTFSAVIGTGHSFGSVLTQAVTLKYPTSFTTAILTRFSINSTGQPIFTTGLNLALAS
jgi:predicted alpha/beta superfamily hydrolase